MRPRTPLLAATAAALAALLGGCGGGSPHSSTTSAASLNTSASSTATTAPASTTTTTRRTRTTTTTTTTSSSTSTATTSPPTTTTTSQAAPTTTTTTTTQTTRTESAPAFVGGGAPTGALAKAIAVLAHHGATPVDTSTYVPADTLHVLIGRGAGGELAFFFNEGQFIGTDASTPSARISVVAHGDSDVTLAYDVYAPGSAAPTGRRRVSFALDMGQLSALGPLPSVALRR